jgi:phosphoribosylanthranilate isomerase
MPVAVKVCGLTRAEDAALATSLGAAYLGFIFAPSARQLTVERAQSLLAELDAASRVPGGAAPQRVGVFAGMDGAAIAETANRLGLDIVQLHGADDARLVEALRGATAAKIWTVVHVGAEGIDETQLEGATLGDGLLLDAKVDGMLGGTGQTFDWARERERVAPLRAGRSIILAGGLRAENVGRAIAVFSPDVVDVSSGVERAPGLKDPERMRAFVRAVHAAADLSATPDAPVARGVRPP